MNVGFRGGVLLYYLTIILDSLGFCVQNLIGSLFFVFFNFIDNPYQCCVGFYNFWEVTIPGHVVLSFRIKSSKLLAATYLLA